MCCFSVNTENSRMKITVKEITSRCVGNLWEAYLKRIFYAQKYGALLNEKNGRLVFDHLAFRTLNTHTGEQPEGIKAVEHIFDCFGYRAAAKYTFKKKKLNAVHLEHPDSTLPKIFVSQLEVKKLPDWAQQIIGQQVRETPYLLSDNAIELLNRLKADKVLTEEAATILIKELQNYFVRPWKIPFKDVVLKLNDVSHYAAWVLLYGNAVNHFAVSVNEQRVDEWPNVEATAEALEKAGIPMNKTIEGENGGKLRQTTTQAVKEEVEVKAEDDVQRIPWTYAYLELVQRGIDMDGDRPVLFSGFVEKQERHLFGITVNHDN